MIKAKVSRTKKISDNRLSSKVYYHPDSYSFTFKQPLVFKANPSLSSQRSISLKDSKNISRLFPSLNILDSNKNTTIKTEPTPENPIIDETLNEVLHSLEFYKTNNNPEYDPSEEFLSKKPQRKNKFKQVSQRKNSDSAQEMNNQLNIRLNYLLITNPNPESKLRKVKPFIPNSISSKDEGESLYFIARNSLQTNQRPTLTKIKEKTTISDKILFFSELNVDFFLSEMLENLKFLMKIKHNGRVATGIIKGFLEFTEEIGNVFLNKEKNDLKSDLSLEILREKLKNKAQLTSSLTNDDFFDMNLLKKFYYFGQSLKRFLEHFTDETSSYQNDKYNEAIKKFKAVQDEYLTHLEYKDYEQYNKNHILLKKNANMPISHDLPIEILKKLENLEDSIGKFPLISTKTRILCKYADHLIEGRPKKFF